MIHKESFEFREDVSSSEFDEYDLFEPALACLYKNEILKRISHSSPT